MFDRDGYESYVRSRVSLERALEDVGDYRGSREIELRMRFAEERLLARIKQAHHHAASEIDALHSILTESTKDVGDNPDSRLRNEA